MKKPTTNGNDLYQIGNDYQQSPLSSYFVASSYHDGIYTEIVQTAFKTTSKDGYDDTFFLGKTPVGLNKRVFNVPQSAWAVPTSADVDGDVDAISAVSATFSPDYAVGEFSGFPTENA